MTIIQQGQTEFMQVIADIYSEIPERVSYYGNPSSPHFVIETDKLNILHVDIFHPNKEESIIFYSMGKDIEGMESPVSDINGCHIFRRAKSAYHGIQSLKFIFFTDRLDDCAAVSLGQQVKKSDSMYLVIAIGGFPVKGKNES